jgi:4-amino-4-deoxy-L-arabinose transferase-like glycosyltransferase
MTSTTKSKMLGERLKTGWTKIRERLSLNPNKQFQLFIIALILVIAGQLIMRRTVPIDSWNEMRQTINYWLRVDVKYLGNVMIGMSLTIIGGILFVISSYKKGLFKKDLFDPLPQQDQPILQKFHFSQWLPRFVLGVILFGLLLFRAINFNLEFFDFIFWILCIILFTSAVFRYDKAAGVSLIPDISLKEVGIITLLIIVGLLISTYQLQDIPNVLKGDEGNFFETARFIALGDYRHSIFGFGVYSYPIISSYFQAAIVNMFGIDIWGWRFASVLPAIFSVIPLYLIGRDFFNRWVGIIASLVYISSPWMLSFARLGYNNSQAILFVTFCIWFFYLGLKKNSLFYIYLGGVVAGLGFLTYTSGRLGLVVLVAMFGYTFLSKLGKKGGKRFILIAFLIFIVGWAIIAMPHLTYGNNQDPETLRYKMVEGLFYQTDYAMGLFGEHTIYESSSIHVLDRYQIFYNPKLYGRLLLRGVVRSILGFQIDEYSSNFFLSSSLAGPIAVIFYVFGIYTVLSQFWRKNSFPLLVWFAAGLFFLSIISTYPPRPAHLVPVIPAVALFIGIGIYLSVDQILNFFQHKKWAWAPLQPLLIIVICVTIMIAGVNEYFVESPKMYRPNLEQVMNWAGLHNPKETEFVYVYDDISREIWTPYFFHLGLTSPHFKSVSLDDVLNNNVSWPSGKDFSIFIEEAHAEALVPLILKEFDQANLETIRNRDGNPIGRAIVQGSVILDTTVPLFAGLGSLFTSRVLWVILPLVLLELFLLYKMYPEMRFRNFQAGVISWKEKLTDMPFIPSLGKSSLQDSGAQQISEPEGEPAEPGNAFEIGFFIRLGLAKVTRNYQAKIVLSHQKNKSPKQEETRKKRE